MRSFFGKKKRSKNKKKAFPSRYLVLLAILLSLLLSEFPIIIYSSSSSTLIESSPSSVDVAGQEVPRARSKSHQGEEEKDHRQNHDTHDTPKAPPPATLTKGNPWYGWQIAATPPVSSHGDAGGTQAQECSWRDCFDLDHGDCSFWCRESEEGWKDDEGSSLRSPPEPGEDWVPDVTMLKRMYLDGKDAKGEPWPPPLDDGLCEPVGSNGTGTDDKDLELFRVVPIRAEPFEYRGPKLLCLMYTMEGAHATSVRAARETWAPGCDGFLAFSTKTDPRIPAIHVRHNGAEEYNNMWQKVRSIWKFVGRHYLDDFDFFHLGGDDMYVLPQNLKSFLASSTENATISDERFWGRRLLKPFGAADNYYNVGGPGYTLSRSALKRFYENGLDHPKCMPNARRASEDVWMSKCLRTAFGIWPEDTRDDQGRERYHHFSPASHYIMEPSMEEFAWYFDASKPWGYKLGKDCCAPDSVAFHYIKQPAMVRHLHKLLYGCDGNT